VKKVHTRPNPYSISKEEIESGRVSNLESSVGHHSLHNLVEDTTDQVLNKEENLDEEKISRKDSLTSSNRGRITPIGSPNISKPNAFADLKTLNDNGQLNDFTPLDIDNPSEQVENGEPTPYDTQHQPAPAFSRPTPGGQTRGGPRGYPTPRARPAPGSKLPTIGRETSDQEIINGESIQDKEPVENVMDSEPRAEVGGESRVEEEGAGPKQVIRPPGKFAPPGMRGRGPTRGRGMPGPRNVPPRVVRKAGTE
jgi:hypothetical protein